MEFRPIPRKALPHTVEYKKPKGKPDVWSEQETETLTLKHVYLEPRSELDQMGINTQENFRAVMYWDSKHSTSAEFESGAEIVFNGKAFKIKSFEEWYAGERLHHVRLILE